ncbi:MAG: hypothetical protein JOZ90_08765 [Alphaproteobacteria bacterium]|nr:hypothetical protein [Alphaproteobacteria bacterium]MBV9370295.1 hypothetical protein [Alphaproteobacteria bacterium]MBV9901175.1 hypothetical protein [Alphaproteobacteria bacterium]
MSMRIVLLLAALAGAAVPPAAAGARPPHEREQDEAFRGTRQGRFLPLRAIEDRIVPRMRGFSYLGPELDPGSGRYRLKFMRGPQVVWIDVDARTGEILGRSGF